MTLVRKGINDLDFAFLDVYESIHGLTRPREKRTRWIGGDLARGAQHLNVRRGQRGSVAKST